MNPGRISVALCTCNGSAYLRDQLDSIASQTVLPDELVVCDDVSADNTISIVEDFARVAPFSVRLITNRTKLGPANNFANAIRLCEGDLIYLCDQDDLWSPAKIRETRAAFEQQPDAAYSFSDAQLVDAAGERLPLTLWDTFGLRNVPNLHLGPVQLAILLKRNVITGASMTLRASLRDLILPIPVGWMHDYWIALIGSSVSYGVPIQTPLLMYRQHAQQLCGCLPPPSKRGLAYRKEQFARVCKTSLGTGPEDVVNKLRSFSKCLERLESTAVRASCSPETLALLKQKELHLGRRAKARSSSGIRRIAGVLAEVWTGRYHRFSDSWLSIIRDL